MGLFEFLVGGMKGLAVQEGMELRTVRRAENWGSSSLGLGSLALQDSANHLRRWDVNVFHISF